MATEPEESARRAEDPDFRVLFESAPVLYIALDPSLRIVAVSEAYARAAMIKREDILGRGLFDAFPDNPDDPEANGVRNLAASLRRVLETGVPDAMALQKYDIRKPDTEGGGFEVRYWSPFNSPVLGADGRVEYIIHRVEDVTDFVKLQELGAERGRSADALREQTERMEAEIFSRAQEVAEANTKLKLANEELSRLYEQTRELDHLKTELFANVSHELRTPLALIMGPVAKLLASKDLDEEERHGLEIVDRNARLLYRHVCDLLDVAKLEANRMNMRYAKADLAQIVRFVASHFETLAADRGILYRVEAPDVLPAEVDSEKCQRVVLNLLSNAFKFTPAGGNVSIALGRDGDRGVIRVEDDGPGIPPSMRAAIFDRFQQVTGETGRVHGGTGLGLTIVKEFVELHRGRVDVGESPDGGASFTVALPLRAPPGTTLAQRETVMDELLDRQTVEELEVRRPAAEPPPPSTLPDDAPLVLVVEDNPDMNAFISESLSHRYRVSTAFDGEEGLHKALALRPTLVVTDMMMPRLGGEQMISTLRQKPSFDDLPIIVLSARADETVRLRMLRESVQAYLVKPFSSEELVAKVDALVTKRRQQEARVRALEQRFRATFEQAATGLAHVALDGRWLRVNRKLTEIVGYTDEELAVLRVEDVTVPEERKALRRSLERILTNGQRACTFETKCLRKSGTSVWTNITASVVRDAADAPEYFILVVEDIAWRKAAEERLRQAATLFASTRDAVMVMDRGGEIVAVNPAFTAITEFGETDVLGRHPRVLQPSPADAQAFDEIWREIVRDGHWEGEVASARKSGEPYLQHLRVDSVRGDHGEVIHYVAVFSDVTTLKRAFELEHIAHHDALTGLPNRLLLISRLHHALDHAHRTGANGAVLFFDLDRFKQVNDTLGHAAGDEVLSQVARRFQERMRTADTFARLGGDEFVVVLEDLADSEEAATVARSLIARAAEPFTLTTGHRVSIGTTVGISLFPADGDSSEVLLELADAALYRAKEAGRGTYRFYSDAMSRTAHEHETLEAKLRLALDRHEFVLHFQPVVSLRTRKLVSVEALVRWQSPERGLLYPADFLERAEETGLIVPLGEWIVRESCRCLESWQASGVPIERISIKLSPRQYRDAGFVDRVARILADTGARAGSLELEIPESALIPQEEELEATTRLKSLGFRLSIDDFGTARSSLAQLHRLPVDTIKVSRRFVSDLRTDEEEREVASALIAAAKKLHREVLAECIESEEQLDFLAAQGCDAGQGHWFCRPLPEAQIAGWAASSAVVH